MNNLKLKVRISKDYIKTIINKTTIKKISNIFKVNNFNSNDIADFNAKFNKEFDDKFSNDFDNLTISEFVNKFNKDFISNTSQDSLSFNIDDRFNSDVIIDTNENDEKLNYLETMFTQYNTISLSKSAIKQYLYYYFIPYNKFLIRRNVSFRDIANYCNLSIPTVKANHKLLEAIGLIESVKTGFGKIDFKITGEDKLHKSKKDGGNGYATISIDMLKHLLSYDNVNELKAELYELMWVDAKSGSIGKHIRFNKENLIKILPTYIQKSQVAIDRILNNSKSLFKINKGNIDTSKYESKGDINNKFKNKFKDKIIDLFGFNNTAFSKNYGTLLSKLEYMKDRGYQLEIDNILKQINDEKEMIIDDICKLVMQYGFNKVKSSIEFMFSDYCHFDKHSNITDNEVKNPGAFIRTVIVNNIDKFGSLYKIA